MRKHSFTLIELLIVLVIIGIVATLAIPQYENLLFRFHSAEAKRVLRALSDSLWHYYIEVGSFPSPEAYFDLDIKFPSSSKYYWYQGSLDTPSVLVPGYNMIYCMEAYHRLAGPGEMDPLPDGVVVLYAVGYSKTPPSGNEQVKKMDHEWYRYYYCLIEGQNDVIFEWR